MIGKLKHRIAAAISVVLCVLFLAQLTVINAVGIRNSIDSACSTAERIAKRFHGFDPFFSGENERPDVISPDGYYAVVHTGSGFITAYTDGEIGADAMEAAELAERVLNMKKSDGVVKGLFYHAERMRSGASVVVLVESAATHRSVRSILLISLLLFVLTVGVSVAIARAIAARIAKPVEETFIKQKQFISDAGHELKTPLTVIAANAEMLENEIGENKWLGYIRSETGRMKELVLALLTLAKLDDPGESAAVATDFDLSEAVEGIAMTFESVAFEQGLRIETEIRPGIVFRGVESELKQLAAILIDNAVKHAEKDTAVRVVLSKDGQKKTALRVTNTGEPIPEDRREKIFERFYRADEARTGTGENRFGLGLAIARSIAEKYHGEISVECAGGETTFRVVF